MTKIVLIGLPLVFVGLLFLLFVSRPTGAHRVVRPSLATTRSDIESDKLTLRPTSATLTSAAPIRRAATKAERIAQIEDDYDQLTAAILGGLGADAKENAGPSDTFLRQLALLEHEKRRDLAAVLGPREFEELEFKESKAGRRVNRLLGDTSATEDQRRAVFRVQREFELQFDQVYDATPRAYFEREQARQQTQEKIRAVLGEELFGSWVTGEGELDAQVVTFAAEHGVSPHIARDLRRTRDDYTLRVLALRATQDLPRDQLAAAKRQLAAEALARATAILGPALYQTARAELLNWLPQE